MNFTDKYPTAKVGDTPRDHLSKTAFVYECDRCGVLTGWQYSHDKGETYGHCCSEACIDGEMVTDLDARYRNRMAAWAARSGQITAAREVEKPKPAKKAKPDESSLRDALAKQMEEAKLREALTKQLSQKDQPCTTPSTSGSTSSEPSGTPPTPGPSSTP